MGRVCRIIVAFILLVFSFIFYYLNPAYAAEKVLILGQTVVEGINSIEAKEAEALGFQVEIVDGVGWSAKTTEDFASYRAIILGDPECTGSAYGILTIAEENKFIWGKAVTGNMVIIATDPSFHYFYNQQGASQLIKNGIAFATSEKEKTGSYITLSCYYYDSRPNTPVPALDGLGEDGFAVAGTNFTCPDDVHIINKKHPVFNSLTDNDLSNWRCSVHEGFVKWPSDFEVLATVKIDSYYIPPGIPSEIPYILGRRALKTAPTPFLDLPWDYEGKGLSFNEAALAMKSYFDHEYPLLSSGLAEPVDASKSIIKFGEKQRVDELYSSHDGYDYSKKANVNLNDPVLAAASGTATYVNSCGACGNMILVDHGNRYQTRYMHLQKDGLITSTPGEKIKVNARQQIGLVGATGNVTPSGIQGAHIHFGVFEDKNKDGSFDDNIPDGVTDPYGWQSKESDPWPVFVFDYGGQSRTGNRSYYLWKKKIDKLDATLTSNGGIFNTGRYKVEFPKDTTDKNLNLNILSEPIVKLSKEIQSIGSTIVITASDSLGNIIKNFQKLFKLSVDFSMFDLTRYNTDTLSFYSSIDGINWTKEPTIIDYVTNTATSQIDHLTHFALMAERKDTIFPTTTATTSGQQGQPNWFRSDVQVNLSAQDNEEGLGVDYTLYRIKNGENSTDWTAYITPLTFTAEGHHKIEFYSVDKDENIENVKSIEFDIDKTPPEARIFIDQDKQDLVVEGIDKNQTIVERLDNTNMKKKDDAIYTISDLAGNIIKLDVRDRDKEKKDSFRIYSMQYNQDAPIAQPDNHYSVSYKGNKDKASINEQKFKIDKEVKIKIKYDNKKNQSTITTKVAGEEKVKEIKDGLMLLQLLTEKGTLKYSY